MEFVTFIKTLFSFIIVDKIWFSLFEISFFFIFLYILCKDKIYWKRTVVAKVIRGEESRKLFVTGASIFMTFIVSIIFQITSYPEDGRILLYLVNLGMVYYLFFCSRTFTNELVKWWINWKQKAF